MKWTGYLWIILLLSSVLGCQSPHVGRHCDAAPRGGTDDSSARQFEAIDGGAPGGRTLP